jgi:hypothetical protein
MKRTPGEGRGLRRGGPVSSAFPLVGRLAADDALQCLGAYASLAVPEFGERGSGKRNLRDRM